MASFSETLEKFCRSSKVQSIWKSKTDPFDHVIKRIHSEAAVFDAVNRNKTTNSPPVEKINETIQFLEQNDFWRLNAFSLYANTKDPNILRTLKLLQAQPIRDIWRKHGQPPVQEVRPRFVQNPQPNRVQVVYPAEQLQRCVNELPKMGHFYDFVPQERYNAMNPYGRPNTYFYLQANKIQATSFGPDNRRWLALNEFRLLQQRNAQMAREMMISF